VCRPRTIDAAMKSSQPDVSGWWRTEGGYGEQLGLTKDGVVRITGSSAL